MATVAEIVARPHRDFGYVLFLEGCPFAFTDREELTGTGGFSWINDEERAVYLDLQVPETIAASTNLETGMVEDADGATFVVQDFSRKLIAFVRDLSNESKTVGQRLAPTDDPAPTTLLSADGQTNVDLHEKYIGVERIGSLGQRRTLQVFPGDPLPGYDHAAIGGEVQDITPSQVFDEATHLHGRKVALYRIYRDTTSGKFTYPYWPSWSDQYASGYSLVWHGVLTDIGAMGITWTLKCEGPSSALRKMLGANQPSTWSTCTPRVSLNTSPGAREDALALAFWYESPFTTLKGAKSAFGASDYVASNADIDTVLADIQARIAAVSATAGDDITWSSFFSAVATFEKGQATCQIADSGFQARWALCMHERVWALFGFDPRAQKYDLPFCSDELQIMFTSCDDEGSVTLLEQKHNPPGPGYWYAIFHTIPIGQAFPNQYDGDGKVRRFLPLNIGTADALRPGGSQEVSVGYGSTPYVEGQLARPVDEWTMSNGGGDCDRTGFVAFRGPYRESPAEDPITQVQIAKISWVDDLTYGNTFGPDTDSERAFYVSALLDPRLFGCARKPLDRTWVLPAGSLEYIPISLVGYNTLAPDRADLVLLRTMLSTGTASWSGYEGQGATRTLGDNAHPDATLEEGDDVEVAQLGLGIYHGLIDWQSFIDTANELPEGGANSPLNLCKYGYIDAFDSQELIARIIEVRGWGLGWSSGKYRLFSRATPLSYEDATVTVGPDDMASTDVPFIEQTDLTPLSPKDLFKVTYGWALVDDAAGRDLSTQVKSQDPGARTRASNAELEIDGHGLIPIELYDPGEKTPLKWQAAWVQLWGRVLANWYASPHILVKGVPVLFSKAKDIGPGTVVRFTSHFSPTREGVYGLTAKVGRVYRVEHNLMDLTSTIDVLIQPGDGAGPRRFAPIAVVVDSATTVEGRYNAATRTLTCYADYFGRGGSLRDVTYFEEPAWLGVGGDAKVLGYQHNGRDWQQTFSFDVESVNVAANTVTWKAGTFTGTFNEAMYTVLVLAPWDNQPANSWPRAMFSAHTDSVFKFGAVPTNGYKLA